MKKKIIPISILIVCLAGFYYYNVSKSSTEEKLSKVGYKNNEIASIIKKVPKDGYKVFFKKYDDSLINLITSKKYKSKYFSKYYKYYEKNTDSNIEDIIAIVNSGYDLMDYPASNLLALLVKEKYYINKNVARYLDYGNSHDLKAKKIVALVNSKADLGFYSETNESNLDDGNLVIVNKFYHLPDNYEPDDLVTLSSKYNRGANNKMRKEAADAFMKMVDGAMLDNIIIYNSSSYRSYSYQVNLYNNYVTRDGKDKADIYSARPGYSEHQTGLCSDLNIISSSFAGTKEADWLASNAYKYGFIIRFPKDKEDITGYKYEPWHYRYVGTDAAKIIYENDLTLEEYYAYYIENK